MRPQRGVGLGEKYLQAQEFGQSYVLCPWWSQRFVDAYYFKYTRRTRNRSRFRSVDAHDEQKRINLGRIMDSNKVQNPNQSVDC